MKTSRYGTTGTARRSLRSGLAILFAFGGLSVAVACADSENEGQTPDPDASSSLPPGSDAAVVPDTAPPVDTGVDAGPRICSDEGFCHTDVPAGNTLRAVWGDGAGFVWTVSDEGNVLRYDGTAWTVHTTGLGALTTIWGSGPTDIWIGGATGLYRGTGATPATLTFAPVAVPNNVSTTITSIWGASATDVWAVGFRNDDVQPPGRAYHYTGAVNDGGAPKIVLDNVTTAHPYPFLQVFGSPGSGVWIMANKPEEFYSVITPLRKPVGQTAFTPVALPVDESDSPEYGQAGFLAGASAGGDTSVWVLGKTVGYRPSYWRGLSTDTGKTYTWTYNVAGQHEELVMTGIMALADTDVWAIGEYGRLRHYNGTAWEQAAITIEKVPVIDPFYGLWNKGGGEIWAVGKGIALRRDPSKIK